MQLSTTIAIGTRVRLTEPVDNFPDVLVAAGATGVLTNLTDEYAFVRLDEHRPELDEWRNELQIHLAHYDGLAPLNAI